MVQLPPLLPQALTSSISQPLPSQQPEGQDVELQTQLPPEQISPVPHVMSGHVPPQPSDVPPQEPEQSGVQQESCQQVSPVQQLELSVHEAPAPEQLQLPETHCGGLVHWFPQLPQLFGSVVVLVQAPLQQ